MALSFFWHDYETFGIDTRRDAPAQFAGIRTDAEFNETGRAVMFYCRPPRDALPDPESCLLTGITPQACEREGVAEAEFSRRVLAELGAPGTVGVGYNSLAFDDEVTRHLFWRNLIDPYGREWQNGCGRWDLFNAVRCAYALRPESLNWPLKPDGRPSLKLEHLTAANGLAHDAAHDALSDVRATIALARRLRSSQPRLFDYCLGLRDKRRVQEVIGGFSGQRQPLLHVSGQYGHHCGFLAVVWPLAPHPTRSNEVIVWDLSQDPCELLELSPEDIRQRLFTRRDDLAEGVTRLPIKTIHINKSPVVVGQLSTLSGERAERLGIDMSSALGHAQAALARFEAFDALPWNDVYAKGEPSAEPLEPELSLYGGPFLSLADRRTLERLPLMDGPQLARQRPHFEDARLDELLLRYRARNWPQTLDGDEASRWLEHRMARLHGGRGGFRTLQQFQQQIDDLALEADERQQALLEQLLAWAEAIAS